METKILLTVFSLIFGTILISPWGGFAEKQVAGEFIGSSAVQFPETRDKPQPEPYRAEGRPEPDLTARAVLVRDISSGAIILEDNIDEKLPVASLTKLMTAIVVLKSMPAEQEVSVKAEDLNTVEPRIGFFPGEKLTAGDLLKAMLISSANDATLALARAAGNGEISEFVKDMNREARRLGMFNTSFANPVGFDHPAHYSTAADLSILVDEFLRYPRLVEITGTALTSISSVDGKSTHHISTTNELLEKYGEVAGIKTGYTREAKGNLIITVHTSPISYYSIILGSDDREGESETVMRWLKENFNGSN